MSPLLRGPVLDLSGGGSLPANREDSYVPLWSRRLLRFDRNDINGVFTWRRIPDFAQQRTSRKPVLDRTDQGDTGQAWSKPTTRMGVTARNEAVSRLMGEVARLPDGQRDCFSHCAPSP